MLEMAYFMSSLNKHSALALTSLLLSANGHDSSGWIVNSVWSKSGESIFVFFFMTVLCESDCRSLFYYFCHAWIKKLLFCG